jgi:hypothetical protein
LASGDVVVSAREHVGVAAAMVARFFSASGESAKEKRRAEMERQ